MRKRILEILKEQGAATVIELAAELDMVPVSVRHHLDILQGDNLILVDQVRRQGNVGRPQLVYALTVEAEQHFPDNFARLAAGLVRQLKRQLEPRQVEGAFCGMARDIAREAAMPEIATTSVEERLERVSAFLSARGYLARWEPERPACAGDSGKDSAGEQPVRTYLLHTCNCPYAAVSTEHRELCLMDQVLVSELVGEPCQRVESLAYGGRSCAYRVGSGAEAGPGSQAENDLRISAS